MSLEKNDKIVWIEAKNLKASSPEHLRQLEQLQGLEFYNLSYEQIPIKENSIIYCDPPYAGTAKYDKTFDHKSFFDWADSQSSPVFISEYNISDKRFKEVWSIKKRSLLSSNKELKNKIEKVYENKAGLKYL